MNGERKKAPAILLLAAFLVLPAIAGSLAFHCAVAPERDPDGPWTLLASSCERLPDSPHDPVWSAARAVVVPLTPHGASPRSEGRPTNTLVDVRALAMEAEVAFLLEWVDNAEDRVPWPNGLPPANADPHGDRWGRDIVGIQFPLDRRADGALPNVLFGNPSQPVKLWLWTAGSGVEEFVASGPASFQASKPVATERVKGDGEYGDRGWSVTLRGRLDAAPSTARPIPFAVYLWDGDNGDAGLATHSTAWWSLSSEDPLPLAAVGRGFSAGLGVLLLQWALLGWVRRPR